MVAVCRQCNKGFSKDEEYFRLFLHSVLVGSTDPERHTDSNVARGLRRHKGLRKRIQQSRCEQLTLWGGVECSWTPEIERINRVVAKNARGHVLYEFGVPVEGEPDCVTAEPLQRMTPEMKSVFSHGELRSALCPEVGCRMMTRLIRGEDIKDGWIVVQDGIYKYWVDYWGGGMRVRSVLYEYLGTVVCWDET